MSITQYVDFNGTHNSKADSDFTEEATGSETLCNLVKITHEYVTESRHNSGFV